jgi:holo-[acyl-carrier protein] synthase
MIVGIGVDLVAIERMRALVRRHGDRVRHKLFTVRELEECDQRADPGECLAARFAAKEATLKAIGTGKMPDTRWTDIEVVRNDDGRPELVLSGRVRALADQLGVGRALVSLSHEREMAAAFVVLETG